MSLVTSLKDSVVVAMSTAAITTHDRMSNLVSPKDSDMTTMRNTDSMIGYLY